MVNYRIAGVLALCLSFAEISARCQVFTDMFADRQTISGNAAFLTGSNDNATSEPSEPLHAGKVGGHSVWISWVAPDNGLLTLNTSGSSFDTLLGVYILRNGTNNALQRLREVAADDDDDDTHSLTASVSFGAISNQEYEIAVDGFNGATGNIAFQLNFVSSSSLQPTVLRRPGDQALRLGDPLILSVGIVRGGDMNLQWYLNGIPITDDSASPTLVIPSLQATNLGFYTVRLQMNDDNFFSTPVEVQANSEGQVNVLARYKAPDAGKSGVHHISGVNLGYNGTQIFNTTNSIVDTNAPAICGVSEYAPYWFAYQPPTNGMMTVDTTGSSFPTILGVFTYNGMFSSYTNLYIVTCDTTNGPNNLPSRIDFQADMTRNYFIVVDGYNGVRGIAHLNYNLAPGFPAQPPVIASQPQPLTVARQTAVSLNVLAAGTAPLNYQWWKDGTLLNKQTNATYLLNNPKTTDSGNYFVVVSNSVGAVTSTPAPVTVISSTVYQTTSNTMVSGFPGARGYQYTADCAIGGMNNWYPWTNAFPDYGGIIWLTNTMDNDSLFIRVHSP